MGILCNTGCKSSQRTCNCKQTLPITQVAGEIEEVAVPNVQAMLQTVVDSCCEVDEVTREISVPCTGFFDCVQPELGGMLDLELNGDITFREVSRSKDECNCVSSVRFSIPIRITTGDSCGCAKTCIDRVVTVIRTVELCCTKDSQLLAANTKVIAGNAWISEICCDHVQIMISLDFRSCLQQTVMRIFEFPATAICSHPNCKDIRQSFVDNCDLTCGCVAGKTCPECS